MCGINGILDFEQRGQFGEIVQRMNHALAHRGPDDEGVFVKEGIALGHRRLSIIDLSPAGHQPMHFSNNRFTIVYNGELYNYRELKNELKEFSFRTNSDTEVILASYAKWGTACLEKFNGMFALAIWDDGEKELFIARDRLGIKPLYFVKSNGNFVFSSEVRGLLASGLLKPVLNRSVLGEYVQYQTVYAPATIVQDAEMLLPGHYARIKGQEMELLRWWEPRAGTRERKPYAEICSDVKGLLRDAVERRLIADVPFGAFLSGGIDSSAIVALMSEVAVSKVKTFSVVFDDSEFSEAKYARLVSKKFGTEHHEIKLSPDDFLHELPAALDAMDHPSGDGPNTFVVSKATKNAGITMALSGLGGDELFAGYDVFRRISKLEKSKLMSAPLFIRKMAAGFIRTAKRNVAGDKMALLLEQKHVGFDNAYPVSRQIFLNEQMFSLFSDGYHPVTAVWDAARNASKKAPGKDQLISRISIAEIETYMQNVLLRDTDQMSMAHALEVRVPFLDYKLVEYVLSLPDEMKFPSTPKKLLVDSLGDLLPREIVDRPKMGFTFPWKHWMKNELKNFCEERLKDLGKREQFDPKGIDELWNKFLKDDPRVTWSRIWPLVVLSHWLGKNHIND